MKTLQEARIFAAKINRKCAAEALSPDFGFAEHVTHEKKLEYVKKQITLAEEIENGLHDHNFTIAQRMHFFMTGECVPLLT